MAFCLKTFFLSDQCTIFVLSAACSWTHYVNILGFFALFGYPNIEIPLKKYSIT